MQSLNRALINLLASFRRPVFFFPPHPFTTVDLSVAVNNNSLDWTHSLRAQGEVSLLIRHTVGSLLFKKEKKRLVLILAVAWFIQSSESVYNTRAVTLAAIPDDARVLPLHLRAHTVAHLSSFARESNQQRERWKPIKCFLLHVVQQTKKQTICSTFATNTAKERECWFGVSGGQDAGRRDGSH